MKPLLTIGVIGKSLKENEKRVAIHPDHLDRIPKELRKNITFEAGYGLRFGMDDTKIASLSSGRVASRKEIFNNFDIVLIPKPLAADLEQIHEEAIIWGWPHCVQQKEVTQIAIDRKLTLIAWEEMFLWNQGEKSLHTFCKNNELAGYAGVTHALSLIGLTGNYGKAGKAVVLSYGSVSRGAVYALQSQGYHDITVYTHRDFTNVADQLPTVVYLNFENDAQGNLMAIDHAGNAQPFSDALSEADVIVNGILQNPLKPLMFVPEKDAHKLKSGALIVDISCDEGMGFWCARPTSFKEPMLEVQGKYYYSVDHSPSYYWNSASFEISEALLPFLETVMKGPDAWPANETISKAVEIKKGHIQNQNILTFQKRARQHPHLFVLNA
ncbi:MAG: alanine dehydrogenase [Bacteroidetes bacterium]|nr:MAG: alanine dehydrogenase [Bacteroidota bacterium]